MSENKVAKKEQELKDKSLLVRLGGLFLAFPSRLHIDIPCDALVIALFL